MKKTQKSGGVEENEELDNRIQQRRFYIEIIRNINHIIVVWMEPKSFIYKLLLYTK